MADKELTWEELELQNERLLAQTEIRYIVSTYMYVGSNFLWKQFMRNWADRDDCLLYMPWGQYYGKKGVLTCYMEDHGDSDDPEYPEWMRGNLCVHMQNGEALYVAEDGKTARGIWTKTGTETYGLRAMDSDRTYDGYPFDGVHRRAGGFGGWCWGRYDFDFIKENGHWKFWHMDLYPVMLTPTYESWLSQRPYIGLSREMQNEPLDEPVYTRTEDNVYPANRPAVPAPYRTFAEVAPGYGKVYDPSLDKE